MTMATLSELVEVTAEVEGIDQATVALIGRHLREAGQISKHGRGPSAAHMGWVDGANLLIGINATRNAAQAARAVQTYRRLRPDEVEFPNPEVSHDFTLGQAIEQLLMAAGSGELLNPFLGTSDESPVWHDLSDVFATDKVHVELRFRTNAPSALLRLGFALPVGQAFGSEPTPPTMLQLHFSPQKVRGPPKAGQQQSGDRLEETTIGFRTLREVGKLIRYPAP
jgi:hypothetical protein